jgi:hypothetical protein
MSADVRKRQIVDVTLGIIAKHGLLGSGSRGRSHSRDDLALTGGARLHYYLRSHFGKAAARRSRGRRKAPGDAERRRRLRS